MCLSYDQNDVLDESSRVCVTLLLASLIKILKSVSVPLRKVPRSRQDTRDLANSDMWMRVRKQMQSPSARAPTIRSERPVGVHPR